jgi:hypothetical protein
VGKDLAIVIAVTVLIMLPFAQKPFQVDDEVYIRGAEQIRQSPLHPLSGTQRMLGEQMPTYHFTQHPPLLSYYIAAVTALTNEPDELRLHLAGLVFAIGAACAMYSLARRFTGSPLPSTLLLLSTPAFLVMAHGVMTDVPFLALYLGAVAALIDGLDRDRPARLALYALLLTFACFMQYRGVILIPLCLAYAVGKGRRLLPVVLASLPAVLLLGLWCLYTWWDLGIVHPLDAGSWIEFRWSRLLTDSIAYTSFLGGATLFPAVLVYLAWPRSWRATSTVAVIAATIVTTLAATPHHTLAQKLLFATFFASGLGTVVWLVLGESGPSAADDRARRTDEAFLLLMIIVPLLSQVFLNLFASVRSLLLVLPFIVLVLVRNVERRERPTTVRGALWAGVALTLASGLTVAVADYRFAEASRDVALRAAAHRGHGQRAWFKGEWGFRYYIERRGFTALTATDKVAEGDLVAIPDVSCPGDPDPALLSHLALTDTVVSAPEFPVKVMSFDAHSGFYSDGWGPLPYSISSGPLERARLYRVDRPR